MIKGFNKFLYALMKEEGHGVEGLQEPIYHGEEVCDSCHRQICCEPTMCKVHRELPEDLKCSRCSQERTCILGPRKIENYTSFVAPEAKEDEKIDKEKARVSLSHKGNDKVIGKLTYGQKTIGFVLYDKAYEIRGSFGSLDLQRRAAEAIKKVWKKWKTSRPS